MGIKIKWDSQADQNLDSISVLRDVKPIDPNDPPHPLDNLEATDTEYNDDTVENKTVYYYMLRLNKGGEHAFSSNYCMGYFSDTGPGPTEVIRGDWENGFFGELTVAEFISSGDIFQQLPVTAGLSRIGIDTWYKFVYKGKILFVPNTRICTGSFNSLYAAGLIYGEGFGVTPTGPAGTVEQGVKIVAKDYEFLVRAPTTGKPPSEYLTVAADMLGGEARDIISRLNMYTTLPAGSLPRYSDASVTTTGFVTQNMYNATQSACAGDNDPEGTVQARAFPVATYFRPVLELLLP